MKDFTDTASDLAFSPRVAERRFHGIPLNTPANATTRPGLPALRLTNPVTPRSIFQSFYARFGKRLFDLALLVLTLPLTLPLVALAVLALATEGKPIFYWQKRVGQNGRVFNMLKLRTMVPGADQILEECLNSCPKMRHEWETTQKLKQDPRITKIGKILRSSSLDELPQLWNVLKGDMSLVGPRPMLPAQMPLYGDMRPYVAMRPGITGLWQVTDRNEGDFTTRVIADRAYKEGASLKQDLKILLMTVGVVVRGTGY